MPFKSYAKKATKFVKKRVIAPYTSLKKNRGYNNRMKLYKEVAAIKKMVNAEKHNVSMVDTTTRQLAQFNGVVSGGNCISLMPTINQGTGEDNRIGDSIKVCSWVFKVQVFNYGPSTVNDINYKFYILRMPTNPLATGSVFSQFLELNQFSGVYDANSDRNYEQFKDFTVMGMVTGKIKALDSPTSTSARTDNKLCARKQEFHIRFEKGTSTVLNNQLYLLAVASDGNYTANNCLAYQYSFKLFYYDN